MEGKEGEGMNGLDYLETYSLTLLNIPNNPRPLLRSLASCTNCFVKNSIISVVYKRQAQISRN